MSSFVVLEYFWMDLKWSPDWSLMMPSSRRSSSRVAPDNSEVHWLHFLVSKRESTCRHREREMWGKQLQLVMQHQMKTSVKEAAASASAAALTKWEYLATAWRSSCSSWRLFWSKTQRHLSSKISSSPPTKGEQRCLLPRSVHARWYHGWGMWRCLKSSANDDR